MYTICAIGFRFELSVCYVQVHEKRKKHKLRERDVKKERKKERRKNKKRKKKKKKKVVSGCLDGSNLIETTQESGSHQIGFFTTLPL